MFPEMVRMLGSDVTKGGLEWQFRRYKAGAKLQKAAVDTGKDPKDVNFDVYPKGEPSGCEDLDSFLHLLSPHPRAALAQKNCLESFIPLTKP